MIAVLNAERHLDSLLPALQRQRLQPDRFLVMDSQSDGSGAERFRVTGVEGRKFVASELRYLANHAPFHIGSALVRIGMKAVGYSLGRRNRFIPASLKRCLSLHRDYWGYDDRSARQN